MTYIPTELQPFLKELVIHGFFQGQRFNSLH